MALERLNAATPGHHQMLEEIVLAAPTYYRLIEHRLPAAHDAEELLLACPPGMQADDKFVLAIVQDDESLGCIDLIRGYPVPETAFLGLLLLKEGAQGQGIGTRMVAEIMALAASWHCTRLRLAVIETNAPAMGFWRKHGFSQVDRKVIAGFTGDTLLMERAIPHPVGPDPQLNQATLTH